MPINLNSTNIYANRKGFTLLEILIAVFILVIVLTTAYASYRGTFRIIKETEDDAEIYGMARTAMDRITKDLSSVSIIADKVKFVSRSEETGEDKSTGLTFIANAHLVFGQDESISGLGEITYYIDEERGNEGNYRLLRKDLLLAEVNKVDQAAGGYVLCEQLHSLTFKFFDSASKEYESWDSTSGDEKQRNKAPAIVAIELKLVNPKDKEHPYIFSTKVLLPVLSPVSTLP